MALEQRTLARISKDFPAAEYPNVIAILNSYGGPEAGRVIWDILELSKGSIEKVRQYLEVARKDYRDILYWAEYYDNDPLLRNGDPKQMVDEILAKWGK